MTEPTPIQPTDPSTGAPPPAPANPEPSPSPSPAPAPTDDWRAALPEDLRADPALKPVKDVVDLAKGYVHAQKLVGMDRNKFLVLPGEDADEDTLNQFYGKLGRPEDPEQYELPVDDKMFSDDFKRNEDMEKWFKGTAHKLGLSNKQAKGLYAEFINYSKGTFDQTTQTLAQAKDEATAALKKEWGAAYDAKLAKAVAPVKAMGDESFVQFLDTSGLGNHPEFIKMMAKIGEALGEDSISDKSKNTPAMTPAEASAAIAQKQMDKEFMTAYRTKDHPSHAYAMAEMSKLFKWQAGEV